ncbi:hypothetical protein ACS0TY_031758 [Phlomoides rotata]
MDFKGIAWAGNIYQKFEDMCLEVEEVMYEDTAKYVENQVEKVGVSVKKLYAEIMQDLRPLDPAKVAAGDLPYAQADINKKPKTNKLDIHEELHKKETTDEDISDPTAEESPLNVYNDANHFSSLSPRVPVENTCSAKSKKVGIHKRPIGIKRISKSNHPPKVSRVATSSSSSSRDGSNLLVYDMKSNYLVASADINVTRSSEFIVRNDQNLSAERKEKNDPQSTSPATDNFLSDESLKQKKDDSEYNSSCHVLPTEPIETFREDRSLSQMKSNIGSSTFEVESEGEEVIVSYEDNFNVEVIKTEDDVEPVEKSKLEESCILVELDKLDCVSLETKTHKSYKKKICEALSSKLRSTGKQDQHVFQYKDVGLGDEKEAGVGTPDPNKRITLCESDWELL